MVERIVWAMTTGEAGYRSQALGLAEAIGGTVVEKTIGLRWPWSLLPGHLCPSPLAKLDPAKDIPSPPWPDVLVTCGRRSTGPSIAIRRAAAGRTLTVHVQNPNTPASAFDLVVPMIHDRLTGPNVLPVATALHRVTAAGLTAARTRWASRFADIPHPRLGVLLGGPPRSGGFDVARTTGLLHDLEQLHATSGIGLLVTPSRRTPPALLVELQRRFAGKSWAYVWQGSGDNPYFGILALADALVVTADSVSMISEAIATGKPVGVAKLGEVKGAPRRFIETLAAEGLALPFTGGIPKPLPRSPGYRNPTEVAADRVREMLAPS